MKEKIIREVFEITYYTTRNCGGIAFGVIINAATYPKYGVKPYKISTNVDNQAHDLLTYDGVKPYKISTIVDTDAVVLPIAKL